MLYIAFGSKGPITRYKLYMYIQWLTLDSTVKLYKLYVKYFVNRPLPWYTCCIELYRPEAEKLSKKWSFACSDEVEGKWETLITGWKLRDCINSIQHTMELVYSFYVSTTIFHYNWKKQNKDGGSQVKRTWFVMDFYYVSKLNLTYDWSLHPYEIAITWKYHGLLFGKSLSQLEALEVLEQLIKCVKRWKTYRQKH